MSALVWAATCNGSSDKAEMPRFLGRPLLRKAWLAGALAALGTSVCLTLDINKASEADLDGLRGLGPATTRLILIEREKALFKNWQDLLARVKGIGPASAAQLSAAGLTVNGQAYQAGRR